MSDTPADSTDNEKLQVEKSPLTPRQARFVQEYIVDLNGTQAAIRAGYSFHTASEIAVENLTKPLIIDAIEKLKAQRASRVNVKQEDVLHETSLLANSDLSHYYIDDEGQVKQTETAPEGAMRAISSIKRRKTVKEDKDGGITVHYDVEIRLWDKPGALKLMGRHVGLFPNRVEVTGRDGKPIELTAMTNEELQARAARLSEIAGTLPDEDS